MTLTDKLIHNPPELSVNIFTRRNTAQRSFYCKTTLPWHVSILHTQQAASRWIKAGCCEIKVILSSIMALSSIPKRFINRQPNRAQLHPRAVLCFSVQSHWFPFRNLVKIITYCIWDNTAFQLWSWACMGCMGQMLFSSAFHFQELYFTLLKENFPELNCFSFFFMFCRVSYDMCSV